MFKSNLPNNVSFIETIAFYGDGGKRVYSSWKEVIINLLISIVGAIIFGVIMFILLPIMYR